MTGQSEQRIQFGLCGSASVELGVLVKVRIPQLGNVFPQVSARDNTLSPLNSSLNMPGELDALPRMS